MACATPGADASRSQCRRRAALSRSVWWGGLLALSLACSATPEGDTGSVANGGTLTPPPQDTTCTFEPDRCEGCEGCLARCLCLTQNTVECPIACGDTQPPPPPPTGGNGGGGGTPPPPPPPPLTGGNGGNGGGGGTPPPATGGTTGGNPCPYPPGPYGTSVGATVAPSLSWQGFAEGSHQAGTVNITDYHDCDGTRGVNALVVNQSAVWCGVCKTEAKKYNSKMAGGFKQKGIRILSLMIENAYGQPATLKTAQGWKDSYSDGSWAVVADPDFTFSSPGSNSLPTYLIVNPRTMKIIDRRSGGMNYSKLESLAAGNAK